MIKVVPERICGKSINIGEMIPLTTIKQAIINAGMDAGLPIVVEDDQLKVGKGIGSMVTSAEPCIVISNTNHRKDYYGYALTISRQGNMAYLTQYLTGDSKNFKNEVYAGNRGGLVSGIVGGMAKKKKIEEDMYYDAVNTVIGNAMESLL